MTKLPIDLNLDAGESWQALNDGSEEALYQLVTSVNIACGGHAGTDESMTRAVQLAHRADLKIGAHPSFPDQANFGRKILKMPKEDLVRSLVSQIQSLQAICKAEGAQLTHIKPHGALYLQAAVDLEYAQIVFEAARQVDAKIPLVGLAGSPFLRWCNENGIEVLAEAFADRRYESDGRLRSREFADAVILEPLLAAKQALLLVRDKTVLTADGKLLKLHAQTICIHGDTENALEIARQIHQTLSQS